MKKTDGQVGTWTGKRDAGIPLYFDFLHNTVFFVQGIIKLGQQSRDMYYSVVQSWCNRV